PARRSAPVPYTTLFRSAARAEGGEVDPRFSLLTFPQRFDGARLHLRVLLVPRLGAAWSGDPLLPLIENFPNAGDTTPAFADADIDRKSTRLNSSHQITS